MCDKYGSSCKFDTEFKHLLANGTLKWLPWIGQEYKDLDTKILVVGESHYQSPNGSHQAHGDNYTRACISESMRNYQWKNLTYTNLLTVFGLLPNTNKSKQCLFRLAFTNKIVYVNVIQRLLKDNKERPSKQDWKDGIDAVHQVIEVLQPTIIVFISISAITTLNKQQFINFIQEMVVEERVNDVKGRIAQYVGHGKNIPCLFLRHTGGTGGSYCPAEWNTFLFDTSQSIKSLMRNINKNLP